MMRNISNWKIALDGLEKTWDSIKCAIKLSKNEFINTVKFVLTSTYFIFNGNIYKQIFGTLMDSPLSPIISDIVIKDLEKRVLKFYGISYFYLL